MADKVKITDRVIRVLMQRQFDEDMQRLIAQGLPEEDARAAAQLAAVDSDRVEVVNGIVRLAQPGLRLDEIPGPKTH